MSADSMFPILYAGRRPADVPKGIPWRIVSAHEKQAVANHSQTLERLAHRGGLCPTELVAVLEDRPWRRMDLEVAIKQIQNLCLAFEAGRGDARHLEVLRMIALRYGPTIGLDDCIALAAEVLADRGELLMVCGRPPLGLDAAMKLDPIAARQGRIPAMEATS
ncbi:hypothetical protein J2847_005880 [Azospirillum agricola]|uniref:hypothetical protein n=1 Tax=Azospirillum agricola TaxID=1720247 RepID=UPI001AEA759D|nr:hypothetical protein [Azospirillum agricola]MBP2232551.1 hypothetical protein [Azospirillum agricola]